MRRMLPFQLALVFLVMPRVSYCQAAQAELLAKTVAGELITQRSPERLRWQINLKEKAILQGEGQCPQLMRYVKQPVPPFDEVIVLQQVEGTYCNGGTVWFLGLKQDGTTQVSPGIGKCFAREPVIIVGKNFVKLMVKGGYGNHPLAEEPYLPGRTWLYKNGQVIKINPRKS